MNGDTYEGEWKDGLKHGEGTEWSFPDALAEDDEPSWKFRGLYEFGIRHGCGWIEMNDRLGKTQMVGIWEQG